MEPIRKLYAGGLADESIVATNVALAGGTATHMARATFAGVLASWLYAIFTVRRHPTFRRTPLRSYPNIRSPRWNVSPSVYATA